MVIGESYPLNPFVVSWTNYLLLIYVNVLPRSALLIEITLSIPYCNILTGYFIFSESSDLLLGRRPLIR